MSELTYENLLNLVQKGDVEQVASLLDTSNGDILTALGAGKYDELLEASFATRNPEMVKALFRHTNLISRPALDMKEHLLDAYGWENADNPKFMSVEDSHKVHKILDYVDQWEQAMKRANLQTYKGKPTEWQAELKKAQDNGFEDLADRIQRRLDFENTARLEKEQKRPEGTIATHWMNQDSWILDGQGRLEYDMYGRENRDEIIQTLKDNGIVAQPLEDAQKTGGFSNYRVLVQAEYADRLKEFLKQDKVESEEKTTPAASEEDIMPQVVSAQEFTEFVSQDDVKDFVQKIHQVNQDNNTTRESTAGALEFFLSDKNKDAAMLFMDGMEQAPITRASKSPDGKLYFPDNEFAALNANQDFSKSVFALELMAWSGNKLAINRTNDCAERAKGLLKSLADKDYPQAQISYAFLLAGDENSDKAEIEKYLKMAQENKNTPDFLKNSTELAKTQEILKGGDKVIWPHLIKYPETEKTIVTPKEEEKESAEQPVEQQPKVQEEKTTAKTEPTKELKDLTPDHSPLIYGDGGYWSKDKQGRMVFDTSTLTEDAIIQAFDILDSYGITPQISDKKEFFVRKQDVKALKKVWAHCNQYTQYNKDLLTDKKPELIQWNSPGMEKYWCRHHTKNMWIDNHPDVSSFNLKWKPYYLNIDGFDDSVVQATKKYLDDMKIKYEMTTASEDMESQEKGENPIVKGQKVIVVKGNDEIKKLNALWDATKRAPELANPPKGMLPNGMNSVANDVPKAKPAAGKAGAGVAPQPQAPKTGTGIDLGLGKQLKNVGGSLVDTLANFSKNTIGKDFKSPEEFGEEFLYQMMAFPLDWMKAYLDTIAKEEKDPAKKAAAQKTNDELLKKLNDIQKQAGISNPSVEGYTPDQHAQRVKALRDYFNAPENAAKRDQLKQMAQLCGQNPEAFKNLYDKMFPNAPFSFEEAMQAVGNEAPTQEKMMAAAPSMGIAQPQMTSDNALLLQIKAELEGIKKELAETKVKLAAVEQELADTKAQLVSTQKELAETKAELAETKTQMAAKDTEILALRQQLQDVKEGKIKPSDIKLAETKEQPKETPEQPTTEQPVETSAKPQEHPEQPAAAPVKPQEQPKQDQPQTDQDRLIAAFLKAQTELKNNGQISTEVRQEVLQNLQQIGAQQIVNSGKEAEKNIAENNRKRKILTAEQRAVAVQYAPLLATMKLNKEGEVVFKSQKNVAVEFDAVGQIVQDDRFNKKNVTEVLRVCHIKAEAKLEKEQQKESTTDKKETSKIVPDFVIENKGFHKTY